MPLQRPSLAGFASKADTPTAAASCRAGCRTKTLLQSLRGIQTIEKRPRVWPWLPAAFGPWIPSSLRATVGIPSNTSQTPLLEDWEAGDVLRLQLVGGRHVYAEVVTGTARSTTGATQSRHHVGEDDGQDVFRTETEILCQGRRYSVRLLSTTCDAELGTLIPGQGPGHGATLILETLAGALSSGDSNLATLLQAPPNRHAAALRIWAPLAARLLRPPEQPAAAGQQREQLQQESESSHTGSLSGALVASAHRIMSLEQLRRRAATEPGAWCDGSGPTDPPSAASEDSRALTTAGELACLLEGRRGVVLLQLHVGWDEHDNVPPYGPYKPLVLRLLREALDRSDIISYTSSAPVPGAAASNPGYGLTLILCADKEPFRSWGAHLASFGCQAALEAQSPYYKLLIGRILGYRPDNIAHYIKEKHGAMPSSEVVAAVDKQLTKLSSRKPKLPWNVSSRGGGRKQAKQ